MARNKTFFIGFLLAACSFGLMCNAPAAKAVPIQVTIENLAPTNGTYITPVWVGFHNGGFDSFDANLPAPGFLERLAEDGNTTPISDAFTIFGNGTVQGTIGGALAPGDVATMVFDLDPNMASSRYFSFGAMIIPSNDAFIGNDNPVAYQIFDGAGNFLGANIFISGAMVYDAGTEENTELPAHTAFFGQLFPNTGIDENGVVRLHDGFLRPGEGGILDDPMFSNADFIIPGYPIANIRLSVVPIPGAVWLFGSGLAGLIALRRRSRS